MGQKQSREIGNAQDMARRYPQTFSAPPEDDLTKLAVGHDVQICVAGERFWIEITEVAYPKFVGKVNNDLVYVEEHGLDFGDLVNFEAKHIYKIYTGW